MGSTALLVGIDIGTTGARCMIFDTVGRCVSSAYREYPLIHVRPGWVEQSVPVLLDTVDQVCRQATSQPEVDRSRLTSVGVSAQYCVTCAVSASGALLRPMISWQDQRADSQVQRVAASVPAEEFRAITGCPLNPIYLLGKILWLREHEPDTYSNADKWLQLQELALHHLGSDGYFSDVTQLYATGLWSVPNATWSRALLDIVGLEPSAFAQPVPPGTRVGTVTTAAAARTGLRPGMALCVGAGDQLSGLLGMGVLDPGVGGLTLGTAAMLTVPVSEPRLDAPEFMLLHHPLPGRWAVQALVLGGASAYRWFRDVFGQPEVELAHAQGGDPFDKINALAGRAPPGAQGLLFLPYLTSAGAPHWNADARGAFLGIQAAHERCHFARAVMEGVAMEMRDNLMRLDSRGIVTGTIRLGGGASRSSLWNQIQADVYGRPVELLAQSETAALGAALLGAAGAGTFANIEEGVAAMVHVREVLEPDPNRHRLYREIGDAFADAYQTLAPSVFPRIARLSSGTGAPT